MSASNRWWRSYEQECADHRAHLTVNQLVLIVGHDGELGWCRDYPEHAWQEISPISGLVFYTYSNGYTMVLLCRSDTNYFPFDDTTVRLL